MNKRNYTYKIKKEGKVVERLRTHSIRIFLRELRTIKFLKHDIEVYLRVMYKPEWFNDGWYKTRKDLFFALEAFLDE